MIRVVFDTNIFISAIHFRSSNPRQLLELASQGRVHLLVSKKILAELRGVLRIKFKYDKGKLDLLEELIIDTAEIVEPTKRITFIEADPDDDMVLECAVEGRADLIISGDRHLLDLKKYQEIKIVSARKALDEYLAQ